MKDFYKSYQNIIKLVLAFIIFFFSSYLLLIPLSLLNIDIKKNTYTITVIANVLRAILLALLFRKDLVKDFKAFKKNFWKFSDIAVKYWFIGIIVMIVSNVLIIIFTPSKVATNEQGVKEMIQALSFISLILTGITAPLSEELLFRRAFRNAIKDKLTYILVSGLVFGALHVITSYQTAYDLLYLIPYSSLGIAFAATCAKTENVFPSMMVHSVHNSVATLANIVKYLGMII